MDQAACAAFFFARHISPLLFHRRLRRLYAWLRAREHWRVAVLAACVLLAGWGLPRAFRALAGGVRYA